MKTTHFLFFTFLSLTPFLFISVYADEPQTNPRDWVNARVAPNGTLWSDVLPNQYVNCITEKDSQGKPLVGTNGLVLCQRTASGHYVGDSTDGFKILDSDAQKACQAIGGRLPTQQEFEDLKTNYRGLPNLIGFRYALGSVYLVGSRRYTNDGCGKGPLRRVKIVRDYSFVIDSGNDINQLPNCAMGVVGGALRGEYLSVRCVAKP